ncbi:MAG: AtpZ/AtpI family protein [Methylobacteriaceae bacterium]|nr:AtpZ/AtpI family protein [Methylobacteriaceae bacterium]
MDALSARIEAQRGKPAAGEHVPTETEGSARGWQKAMSLGFRVVSELVAGIIVGGGIGYLLDKWLGTKPFLLILFGLLGTAGGFWNIIRSTSMPLSGPPRQG